MRPSGWGDVYPLPRAVKSYNIDQLNRIEAKVDYLVYQKQRRSFKRRLSDFFQNLANKLK